MKMIFFSLFVIQSCFALTCSPCDVSFDINDYENEVVIDTNSQGDAVMAFTDTKNSTLIRFDQLGPDVEPVPLGSVIKVSVRKKGKWSDPVPLFETDEDFIQKPMCKIDDDGSITVNWVVDFGQIWGTKLNENGWEPVQKLIGMDHQWNPYLMNRSGSKEEPTEFFETSYGLFELKKNLKPFGWEFIGPAIGNDHLGNRLFLIDGPENNEQISFATVQKDGQLIALSDAYFPNDFDHFKLCTNSQKEVWVAGTEKMDDYNDKLLVSVNNSDSSSRILTLPLEGGIRRLSLSVNCKDHVLLVWETGRGIYALPCDSELVEPELIAPTVLYQTFAQISNEHFQVQTDPTGVFILVWQNMTGFLAYELGDSFETSKLEPVVNCSIHGTVYDPLTREWSQIEWLSSISLRSYLKALKIGSGGQNLLVWTELDLESEKSQLKVGSFSLE